VSSPFYQQLTTMISINITTHRHLVSGYRFEASTAEGAILMLPEGASRTDLRSTGKFREYAIKHGVSWYQFVNGTLQEEVHNGSLYLITGVDSATSYGVASFSDSSGDTGTISASFLTIRDDASHLGRSYSWHTQGCIARRTGKSKEGTKNQCVFIRGFKIALNESVFAGLFSGGVALSQIGRTCSSSNAKNSIPFAGGSSSPSANTTASSSMSSSSSSHSPPAQERLTALHDTADDVLLERLPGYFNRVLFFHFPLIRSRAINLQIYVQPLYHPSDVINRFLLSSVSSTSFTLRYTFDDITEEDRGVEYSPR
jgi:hypothetical protein